MTADAFKRAASTLLPGGLVVAAAAIALHSRWLPAAAYQLIPFAACAVFVFGLLLSGIFHRSRIFFALLVLALADLAVFWILPRILSGATQQVLFDSVCILLPLNLAGLSLAAEKGIITTWGRWYMALLAVQAAWIGLLCVASRPELVGLLHRNYFAQQIFARTPLPQIAVIMFALAALILLLPLMWRRKAIEGGLFWALVSSLLGLHFVTTAAVAHGYFAAAGLILGIAVLQKSYSMAYRDELTMVLSRRSFNDALLRLGDDYAIGMVDVDHFKQFNDTYGHATGDQVLRMVASKLDHVSGGGKAFRYGGEEFAVMFDGITAKQALPHLEQVRKNIEAFDFTVRGQERRTRSTRNAAAELRKRDRDRRSSPDSARRAIRHVQGPTNITVSIGLADSRHDASRQITPEEVVRAADKALYKAKNRGRNCVVAG